MLWSAAILLITIGHVKGNDQTVYPRKRTRASWSMAEKDFRAGSAHASGERGINDREFSTRLLENCKKLT